MSAASPVAAAVEQRPGLTSIAREWGWIGCIGFGGPPAHIALFRRLCVERRRWIGAEEFEDAIAATNLLPGPGSTQLSIYCAWRLHGVAGALVGGLSFILPGLVVILALSALFLSSAPPESVLAAGAGAGAAVAAVALHAAAGLAPSSWARASARPRWVAYVVAGALGTILLGPWLVLVLLACGGIELATSRRGRGPVLSAHAWPFMAAAASTGGLASLAWVAFKVGALSYGGGFVIIPLMQHDAVDAYHWMTGSQFLNAVALGQITPGPVVHTVAVVGYAAAGLGGALLAALVAFSPSFSFILIGAERFDRLRANENTRAFLNGAGPAAIGAIGGSTVPLAAALGEAWQGIVLAIATVAVFASRGRTVLVLLGAAAIGVVAAASGAQLPTTTGG